MAESSCAGSPPEHPTVSSTLLRDVQQMDPLAWNRLVDVFSGVVYRWCRVSGVNSTDAADLVQEVFTSVARGIPRFERLKDQGSFRSWLATITRNQVRDHFRKLAVREAATGGSDALWQLEQHAERLDSTIDAAGIQNSLTQRILETTQAEFERPTWDAFWMVVVDGKSVQETAETTGLSLASVYQAKSRVLRRLRQRMAELP